MFRKLYSIRQNVGFRWKGFWVKMRLKSFGCSVGSNFKCWGSIHYRAIPKGNITIGNNVTFGRGVTLEIPEGGKLVIADHVHFADNILISGTGDISFGEWSAVAENVSIRSSFHEMSKDLPYRKQGNKKAPISFGKDTGIGANCSVLMGAVIPDGVFIGSSSLVTARDKMEEYGIYGGNPLHFIKGRA
ncbi:MAG: acyltransferase [Flavobacteriales bacterium]|nr:acyltransferase [Flavobacteriales bacterium]